MKIEFGNDMCAYEDVRFCETRDTLGMCITLARSNVERTGLYFIRKNFNFPFFVSGPTVQKHKKFSSIAQCSKKLMFLFCRVKNGFAYFGEIQISLFGNSWPFVKIFYIYFRCKNPLFALMISPLVR